MRIQDEKSDAIDLLKDIRKEMAVVRSLIAELEFLVYQCDDRCQIEFFDKDKHDTTIQ